MKKYLKKTKTGIKKIFRKICYRRSWQVTALVLVLFLILQYFYPVVSFFKAQANTEISAAEGKDDALFVNVNPEFKVEFGNKEKETEHRVRFEAAPAKDNPFVAESSKEILANDRTLLVKLKEKAEELNPLNLVFKNQKGIEFSLKEAGVEEVQSSKFNPPAGGQSEEVSLNAKAQMSNQSSKYKESTFCHPDLGFDLSFGLCNWDFVNTASAEEPKRTELNVLIDTEKEKEKEKIVESEDAQDTESLETAESPSPPAGGYGDQSNLSVEELQAKEKEEQSVLNGLKSQLWEMVYKMQGQLKDLPKDSPEARALQEKIYQSIAEIKEANAKTEMEKKDGQDIVRNPEVVPNVDVEYQVLEGQGLKEDIILKEKKNFSKECVEKLISTELGAVNNADNSEGADSANSQSNTASSNNATGVNNSTPEECALPSNTFTFELKLDPGVELHQTIGGVNSLPGGTYYFTDKDGNYLFHFLPLFAKDAKGQRTNEVKLEISEVQSSKFKMQSYNSKLKVKGSEFFSFRNLIPTAYAQESAEKVYTMKVSVDLGWLLDSVREYPIRIDPSIVHNSQAQFDGGSALSRVESLEGPKVQIKNPSGGNDQYTKLLLHMDGTDEGTSFLDSSMSVANRKTVTKYDGANTEVDQSKFGGASGQFDGTGDYLSVPNSSDWDFGGGDFTIDMWVRLDAISVYKQIIRCDDSTTKGFQIFFHSSLGLRFEARNGTTFLDLGPGNWTGWTNNTWYHIAVVRNGSLWSLYKDGILIDSESNSSSIAKPTTNLLIAANNDGTESFNGYIDELRISKGIARWTSNFTPPTRAYDFKKDYASYSSSVMDLTANVQSIDSLQWTEQGVATGDGETLKDATNLVAQWNFNDGTAAQNITTAANNAGSCGASCNGTLSGFAAGATTGLDGSATEGWTANNGRWPNSSPEALSFDGTDDYVSVGQNHFETDNTGTISAWVKIGDTTSAKPILVSSLTSDCILFGFGVNGNKVYVQHYNYPSCTPGTNNAFLGNISLDANWHHVVLTSNGSTWKVYVDGVEDTLTAVVGSNTGQWFNDFSAGTHEVRIGRQQWSGTSNYYFKGIIDSLQVYSRELAVEEIRSNYNAGNIEIQTRTGATADPNDGTWEDWKPSGGGTETAVEAMDSGNASDNFKDGYTKLLLHANGANAGTTFYDNSVPSKNIGVSGGAQVATAQSKFGGSSAYFDGNGDYLSLSDSEDWNFGSGNFTIDGWVRITDKSEVWQVLMEQGDFDGSNFFAVDYYDYSGTHAGFRFLAKDAGSSNYLITNYTSINENQWYHIAVVRNSGTVKFYLDGTQIGSDMSYGSFPILSDSLNIGRVYRPSNPPVDKYGYFAGYVDELRLSKGIARWTENFTPPTTQYSDPSWLSTSDGNLGDKMKLLLHGDGADGSTTFTDSSIYGKTATRSGDAHIEVDQSKFGGASMAFDGTGDYVSLPDSNDWNFGSGDFTIDAWIYPTSSPNDTYHDGIVGQWDIGANGNKSFILYLTNNNGLIPTFNLTTDGTTVTNLLNSSVAVSLNTWTHLSVVRNGNNWNLYVNGTSRASATGSYTISNSSKNLFIASQGISNQDYLNGYIDDLRITKGKALWTANFTAPTSAVTNPTAANNPVKMEGTAAMKVSQGAPQCDGNTVALWHLDETGGSNAYINDSCGSNYGTPTGTTVVDGWSGKGRSFSETTDNITIPDSDVFSPSAMTIELWVKPAVVPNSVALVSKYSNPPQEWELYYSGNNLFFALKDSGGDYIGRWDGDGSALPSVGQWHLITAVWNGGTTNAAISLYVDGVRADDQDNSLGTFNGLVNNTSPITIGKAPLYSSFNGSIDEIKISNIARSADEIAESYRAGRDHRISRTISSTDLSSKSKLPFYIAADRPGSYLEATVGESAYANYEPDANTVGLWHLDEQAGSGAYIKDSSSYGNHATPTNATSVEGRIGKGMRFTGASNSKVETAVSGLPLGSSSRSMSAWFKTSDATARHRSIVAYGTAAAGKPIFLLDVNASNKLYTESGSGQDAISSVASVNDSIWHLGTLTYDGTTLKLYLDGVLQGSSNCTLATQSSNFGIGEMIWDTSKNYIGDIDEVGLYNRALSSAEIRQAYEVGRRTHPITIDFSGTLSAGNLIADTNDLSFTVANANGAAVSSLNPMQLYAGDKVIIKENYDGQEYLAQGTVTAANTTSGAVTVDQWDSNSTFPSSGYTANATVFKWQREFMDLTGMLDSQADATTRITLRSTDGSEGRNIYLDDFKSASNYLTNPAATGNVASTKNRYFQYRALLSTTDTNVTPYFSSLTTNYTDGPTNNLLMRHGKWFNSSGQKQKFWWAR